MKKSTGVQFAKAVALSDEAFVEENFGISVCLVTSGFVSTEKVRLFLLRS